MMLDEKDQQLNKLNAKLDQHEIDKACRDIEMDNYQKQIIEITKHINEVEQECAIIVDKTPSLPFNNDSNINENSSEISDEKETQGALK